MEPVTARDNQHAQRGMLEQTVIEAYLLLEASSHSARWLALKLREIGIELTADEVKRECKRLGVGTKEPPKKQMALFSQLIGEDRGKTAKSARRLPDRKPSPVVGLDQPRNRRPVCNSLGERFASIREANASRGYPDGSRLIPHLCNNPGPDSDGVTWWYEENPPKAAPAAKTSPEPKPKPDGTKRRGGNRARAVKDQDGNVYPSLTAAAEATGVSWTTVRTSLKNGRPTKAGIQWSWA